MMRTLEMCARAASSRNLSTRSVASSTVEPIRLISSVRSPAPRCECTDTPPLAVRAGPADGPLASMPTISSTATFMRKGPASISTELPSSLRKITGLLNPRTRMRGFNKPVIFRRLDGNSEEIEAGPLRMKVAVDEIVGIEASGPSAGPARTASGGVSVHSQRGAGERTEEINLIGSTVEEATERVDKFLDDAALAHISRVRIIHGHGTGALRKG